MEGPHSPDHSGDGRSHGGRGGVAAGGRDVRQSGQAPGTDLKPEEFDFFGASARTLRQFCKATEDLAALMRDYMLPDPG